MPIEQPTRPADDEGVVFAADSHGRRSSTACGQAIMVDALAAISRDCARRAAAETRWHQRYPEHIVALVRESLIHPDAAIAAARAGLASAHARLQFDRAGEVVRLSSATGARRRAPFDTVTVAGRGDPAPRPLAIPYRGTLLAGDSLARQLEQWEGRGVLEPSHAQAVREVIAHPEWLDLSDRCFVLLGASAEVGPIAWLAGWRARIALVDLPGDSRWKRIAALARDSNATLIAPARAHADGVIARERTSFAGCGANLLVDLPELVDWIESLEGALTVGAYAYLDGALHVRVSAAMDALMAALCARRRDVSLAMLATPTDVYAVPGAAVGASRERAARRSVGERTWQQPIAWLSGGRFFQPNYGDVGTALLASSGYGICDCLVIQQGPNYALAKRLQQWRAIAARADGIRVSINVAPSTTTHSVLKNPALAAAFAGAHRFGVEAFAPATTAALMAALLVYDLRCDASPANPSLALSHPLELLMHGANHGGMWRMPHSNRSALPFAALLGWPGRQRDR